MPKLGTQFYDIPAFDTKYVVVHSFEALVAYCIPRSDISSIPQPDAGELDKLRSKVCILKIRQETPSTKNERHIHDMLGKDDSQNDVLAGLFLSSLQHGNANDSSWLVSEALCPSLTLGALGDEASSRDLPLPRAFVAHVFLELLQILSAMHHDRNLTHGDLNENNILVDVTSGRDRKEYPKIRLIDFEMGVLEEMNKRDEFSSALDWNLRCFYGRISRLLGLEQLPEETEPTGFQLANQQSKDWFQFRKCMWDAKRASVPGSHFGICEIGTQVWRSA
jgi:serine/threonine protein kinase